MSTLAPLSDENRAALEHYDAALYGVVDSGEADDRWPREPGHLIAVYDTEACIDALQGMGCTRDDAIEWFDHSTSGAWVGQNTPTFYGNLA